MDEIAPNSVAATILLPPLYDLPATITFQIQDAVPIVALFVEDTRVTNIHSYSIELLIRIVRLYL